MGKQLIRGFVVALLALAIPISLSACGDSSGQAKSLLKQTFSGKHRVDSGQLNFELSVNPSGSRTINGPITFSFGGPFQNLGTGKLPASNFTISVSALGKTGSLGLLSTGNSGFVTLSGTSYPLPAATFRQLQSSFAGITSSGQGGTGSGALSKLGIDPLHWLVSPSIVGDESVAGTPTTHIKAAVNVSALLVDLSTFLQKASSLGISNQAPVPNGLSSTTRGKIARVVQNPRFDVWTGKSDKTPRKLTIGLTVPVTGALSTELGGLRTADFALTVQYANLNQPETITAPTTVRPFSEFSAKVKAFQQTLQALLSGALGGGASSSGTGTTSTPGTTTSPANVQAYSQCVSAAGSDVQKLQACSSLLK
ncbi:MAG: hypothetical protein JOZ73_01660 [Solirubrobacterales bacterium]|nr:hypothetical protein [Solirubrobacterales bacterium]